MRPLFSILYSNGYSGDLSIEPHSAVWKGELGKAGIEFTRDFIKQSGFLDSLEKSDSLTERTQPSQRGTI